MWLKNLASAATRQSFVPLVTKTTTALMNDLADERLLIEDNLASAGAVEIFEGYRQQVGVLDRA